MAAPHRSFPEPIARPKILPVSDLIAAHNEILRLTMVNQQLMEENQRLIHEHSMAINGYFTEAAESQRIALQGHSAEFNQLLSTHAQLTLDHSKCRCKISELDEALKISSQEVSRLLRILGGGSKDTAATLTNWRRRRSTQRAASPVSGTA